MPSVTWDTAFEASPADTDEAKYGALKIRQLKVAISERGELELNWKTGTQPFGKAGKLAAVFHGTTTEINALTGMTTNSQAFDTTLNVPKRYTGSEWVAVSIDHGTFAGLSDDDHPQYLNLTKASQTLTENLLVTASKTIDGRDISADGIVLDALAAGTAVAFGSWVTKVAATSYLAATDGFLVVALYSLTQNCTRYATGYTDANSPPTTIRCTASGISVIDSDTENYGSFTMPVKKGDYYRVVVTGGGPYTIAINWIPLGS